MHAAFVRKRTASNKRRAVVGHEVGDFVDVAAGVREQRELAIGQTAALQLQFEIRNRRT